MINSGTLAGVAADVSQALEKHGYTAGQVRDRYPGEPTTTTIDFGAGAQTDANSVAALLGLAAPKHANAGLLPGHIRVTVATNISVPTAEDATTTETATTTATTTTTSGTSPTSSEPRTFWDEGTLKTYPIPHEGQPIGGGGVPCVN